MRANLVGSIPPTKWNSRESIPNTSSDKGGQKEFKSWYLDYIIEFLVFEFFITDFKNFLLKTTFPSHELKILCVGTCIKKGAGIRHTLSIRIPPKIYDVRQQTHSFTIRRSRKANVLHSWARLAHHEPSSNFLEQLYISRAKYHTSRKYMKVTHQRPLFQHNGSWEGINMLRRDRRSKRHLKKNHWNFTEDLNPMFIPSKSYKKSVPITISMGASSIDVRYTCKA